MCPPLFPTVEIKYLEPLELWERKELRRLSVRPKRKRSRGPRFHRNLRCLCLVNVSWIQERDGRAWRAWGWGGELGGGTQIRTDWKCQRPTSQQMGFHNAQLPSLHLPFTHLSAETPWCHCHASCLHTSIFCRINKGSTFPR